MRGTRPTSPCNEPKSVESTAGAGGDWTRRRFTHAFLRLGLAGLSAALLMAGLPSPGKARPETIRPGIAYYDDEYEVRGGVPDLTGEKNYEEVYQFYAYFEARYDAQGRVVRFVAYKRGDVVWRASVTYASDGSPATIAVTDADGNAIPLPEP